MKIIKVNTVDAKSIDSFDNYFKDFLQQKREPVLIKSLYIGSCIQKWTFDYLRTKLENKVIKVHSSQEPALDFINKNFQYKTLDFKEFLSKVEESEGSGEHKEHLYLRSLGDDPRKDICDLWKHFPDVSDDVDIPNLFEKARYFSSVFRIASKGLQLWTHYDIMDNILMEVKGTKRVVLFSPEQADLLYLSGDKSRVINIDTPDFERFPLFKDVVHYECLMEAGDVLFIPALWFHNVTNTSATISVNVFWKNLDDSYYDSKDVYGNKDLLAFSNAENTVDRGISKLSALPDDYKRFYARRLIEKIKNKCL